VLAKKKIKDILQQKQEELNSLQEVASSAFSLVTTTINCLSQINSEIDAKVADIEDYLKQFEATKAGFVETKTKNEKIIKNFNALIDAE
jgi:DNA-binding protein YbaB